MIQNIISVLSRGNQELFHSAMIAWMLDEDAAHGLNRIFLENVLTRLHPENSKLVAGKYDVLTEYKGSRGRYDILLRDKADLRETMIFENKTKSLGYRSQAERYASGGADVALLALLPEMFDEESRHSWPLLTYRDIYSILAEISLDEMNGYQFVVAQYRDFLDEQLRPFELLKALAIGTESVHADSLLELGGSISRLNYGDNDHRALYYAYFVWFRDYLRRHAPDLIFGTQGYGEAKEAGENMMWHPEKSLQGQAFMEAVLYQPKQMPDPWRLRADLEPHLFTPSGQIELIPRFELWGMGTLAEGNVDPEASVGNWLLGIYGGVPKDLWRFVQSQEPYASKLNGSSRRNFHYVPVRFTDLRFDRLEAKLRDLLGFAFESDPPSPLSS